MTDNLFFMVATSEASAGIEGQLAYMNDMFCRTDSDERVVGHAIREVVYENRTTLTLQQVRERLFKEGIDVHVPPSLLQTDSLLRIGGATQGVLENKTYLAPDEYSALEAQKQADEMFHVLRMLRECHKANMMSAGKEAANMRQSPLQPDELAEKIHAALHQCMPNVVHRIPPGNYPKIPLKERVQALSMLHKMLGKREELLAFLGLITAGGRVKEATLHAARAQLVPAEAPQNPLLEHAQNYRLVSRMQGEFTPHDGAITWALTGGVAAARMTTQTVKSFRTGIPNAVSRHHKDADAPGPNAKENPTHPHLSASKGVNFGPQRVTNIVDAIRLSGSDENFEVTNVRDFPSTTAMPGSAEKIDTLAERIRLGLPLWNGGDRLSFEDSED